MRPGPWPSPRQLWPTTRLGRRAAVTALVLLVLLVAGAVIRAVLIYG
jgi:hypothetical protein